MANLPDPSEIFDRAADEGRRRLDQSFVELVSTGFIAGFTIVFGIVALGIAHALAEPRLGELARVAGALAFAPGLVFLVIGRAELFTENFFDPIAAVFERRESAMPYRLARLWSITIVLNLAGGALLALVVAVPEVLPHGTRDTLGKIAEEIARRGARAGLASAIVGGALVALLSYMQQAVRGAGSQIALAYAVGFYLALGPFDHVVVTALHLFLGMLVGAPIGVETLVKVTALAAAGNLIGGVGLVTLSHAAQALGGRESSS